MHTCIYRYFFSGKYKIFYFCFLKCLCTAEKFRLDKNSHFVWIRKKSSSFYIDINRKWPATRGCLVFVSFFFRFILRRTENNNKYNRIALFAGSRTIRITNYPSDLIFSLSSFRDRRSNYVQNKKNHYHKKCQIAKVFTTFGSIC